MEMFFIVGIITIIVLFVLCIAWKNPILLLGIHISSRTLLDGFSEITYNNIVANFSYMQLYSTITILFFIMYFLKIKDDISRLTYISLPIIIVITTYLLSTIISNDMMPAIEHTTKWVYLFLISSIVYHIAKNYNMKYLMIMLSLSIVPALIIQMHTIITNEFIIASGGHRAYFGGYYHQNMLSYLIMIFIVSSLYLSIDFKNIFIKIIYFICTAYGLAALYMCGYRTTIVAAGIMLIITAYFYIKLSNASHKILTLCIIPVLIIIFLYFFGSDLQYRLADIGTFLQSPLSYIDFSGHARHIPLFSGRLSILNDLMAAYVAAPLEAIIAGLGVEASQNIVGTYPHNEFLAALVECGILGFVALCVFMTFYLRSLLRCLPHIRIQETIVVGAGTGLIALTLATMPFRDMRAMLFFGLIFGITHYICDRDLINSNPVQTCKRSPSFGSPSRHCPHISPLLPAQENHVQGGCMVSASCNTKDSRT